MKIRSEQEKRIYSRITEEMPALPYALKEVESSEYGKEYVYDIPDSEKSEVLENLFIFDNLPSMNDIMLDLHTGRTFTVKDFLVIRYNDRNLIVSPYYFEAGGTLLDFVPPDNNDSVVVETVKQGIAVAAVVGKQKTSQSGC